jgi:outer membrane receptor protein involved in Fe transport
MLSEFFQDDWKITPKLTMNYGLRYDYATWPYSGADRMTNVLDPNRTAVNATATLITPANSPYGSTLVKPDKNNFAPRIGFAYQVTPTTVVRAGYGRFYMLFERAGSEDQMFLNPPYLIDKLLSAPSNNVTANATSGTTNNGLKLRTGFTGVSLDPNAQASTFLTSIRLRSVNPENVQPEVDQWNLGVEHQLPGQVVLTVEYVGTKGTHLSILENLNQQYFDSLGRACVAVGAASPNCPTLGAPGAQTAVGLAPYLEYSNLGAVEWRNNVGNSTYHGLEVSANKRYSKGLSFTTAYTWSHSIDSSMEQLYGGGSNTFLQNMHDLTQWRGNSDFDTRHRLSVSGVYDLPFGPKKAYLTEGPLSQIMRGWRMSTISALHSGRPFTIFSGNNNSLVQVGGQLGSALGSGAGGGACNSVSGSLNDTGGSGPMWFDTTKFSIPTAPNPTGAGTVAALGNCPRNNMYGPGLVNVDFALTRDFEYFGEGRNLAFRWEVFNLLNTPYFGLPGRDVSNASAFGRITNLQGDPRVMQFALRFSF